MKGHVGGGSGYLGPLGLGVSVKAKPFHVSDMQHTCIFVQERLPEMLVFSWVFPCGDIGH